MGNDPPNASVPVILKGTHQIVGYYSGAIPAHELVLRWSDPEDPDFGVEALVIYDRDANDANSPLDGTVKAIMVASARSLAGVAGFEAVGTKDLGLGPINRIPIVCEL